VTTPRRSNPFLFARKNLPHHVLFEHRQTLTRKVQLFGAPLAFSSTMEGVCSAQVQAQNKHSGGDRDAMKKNIFCLALGVMLFALCFSAEAQSQRSTVSVKLSYESGCWRNFVSSRWRTFKANSYHSADG
jgi:hypothetical protein